MISIELIYKIRLNVKYCYCWDFFLTKTCNLFLRFCSGLWIDSIGAHWLVEGNQAETRRPCSVWNVLKYHEMFEIPHVKEITVYV